MGEWIMSIVGVIVLSVLVEVLMPEGQTTKYIKGIFSVITLYVIFSPLPNLVNGKTNLFDQLNIKDVQIEVDNDFLDNFENNQFYLKEVTLEKYLFDNGYKTNVKYVEKINNIKEVDYINVFLDKSSLPASSMNTNTQEDIKKLVANFTGLKAHDIRVLYE